MIRSDPKCMFVNLIFQIKILLFVLFIILYWHNEKAQGCVEQRGWSRMPVNSCGYDIVKRTDGTMWEHRSAATWRLQGEHLGRLNTFQYNLNMNVWNFLMLLDMLNRGSWWPWEVIEVISSTFNIPSSKIEVCIAVIERHELIWLK